MLYRIEFEAGLGDILLSIYRTARYRFLNHLQCDDEAQILVLSCNPHVPELFKWHPQASRFSVIYVPADTECGKLRRLHNLEPNESTIPSCDCPIEFYESPEDALITLPKHYIVLAAGAGTSPRILPHHIIEWILNLAIKYRIPIVAVGRNYIDERRDTVRHEPAIPESEYALNLVDRLTVPGVCNVVKRASGIICSHSAVCMLAWLEQKPTFLLYGQDVWERHISLNDGYCFGLAHNGNQHQQFENMRDPHKLETFFEFTAHQIQLDKAKADSAKSHED